MILHPKNIINVPAHEVPGRQIRKDYTDMVISTTFTSYYNTINHLINMIKIALNKHDKLTYLVVFICLKISFGMKKICILDIRRYRKM